jgi:hypothetical protein
MGWSSGSTLAEEIWLEIKGFIPEGNRKEVANMLYDKVCDLDADDWDGISQLEIDGNINQNLDD